MRRGIGLAVLVIGCGGGAEPAGIAPLAEEPAYAVVLSDYASTAIAMVRADGTAVDDRWVTSGTVSPGLVAALSGDVAIPSAGIGDGTLWLLDRFRTDVLTRIEVPSGEVLGQVRTHDAAGGEGAWSSNPHDVALVADDLAWISRFEANLDPAAPELERGNDLYAIDPSSMARRGMRIGFEQYDVEVAGADGSRATAHARPSSIVRLGDVLVVGLARLTGAFDGAGEGAIVEVSLASHATRLIALEGLHDCARVVPAGERVIVGCAGFGDAATKRATAGIVVVELVDGRAEVTQTLRFGEHEQLPLASQGVVHLEGDRVLALGWGSLDPVAGDQLFEIDLATATSAEIARSAGPFELGAPLFDATQDLALVPDGSRGLRRFVRHDDGSWTEMDAVELAPDLALPVRHIARL
ncbi:hypothetical protein [Sandaracinus amylolyticus]|uniref:Uncharacterized protein n=1 Tax=Sandaracinus amylolyticus TaxID=927083 RepID=A0A0F6SDZ8_9BACT|nr:hypothetical protein [Sandaracinus amylolyticus]AKF04319.1 hypothetical protein DB32_001468 [Sandaracinus amylolyticus]